MNFLDRFFVFFDDVASDKEYISIINIEIFDICVLAIDFDDEDVTVTLFNLVVGFEYK